MNLIQLVITKNMYLSIVFQAFLGELYKSRVLQKFQFPEGFWFEDTPLGFIIAGMNYKFQNISDYICLSYKP